MINEINICGTKEAKRSKILTSSGKTNILFETNVNYYICILSLNLDFWLTQVKENLVLRH